MSRPIPSPTDLRVGELGVSEDGASGLDGFDDLVGGVAGESESRRLRVDLHRSPHRLLRAVRHRVCLVQDHDLVAAFRQSYFLRNAGFRFTDQAYFENEEFLKSAARSYNKSVQYMLMAFIGRVTYWEMEGGAKR